jgi:hypothetical protein
MRRHSSAKLPRSDCYPAGVSLGFQIHPDIGLLFIRGQGVITQPERIRALLAWMQDAAYASCNDAIFDVAATQSTPTIAELRELIALLKERMPNTGPRRLAIVTSRPVTFTIARMFENLVRFGAVPLRVRVFMDPDAAWAWLRPGSPPFQPR